MGAEHEDTLDVSGAAGAGDEGDHAGPTGWSVGVVEKFVSRRKIRDQLVHAGDDHMMGGQY